MPSNLRSAALIIALSSCASAPATQTTAYEPYIASAVAQRLAAVHYQARPLDDALSAIWLQKYIEYLDYARMVFTAQDVAEFTAMYGTRLDDTVRTEAADLMPARAMYDRWQARMVERYTFALALLDGPIDVESGETWAFDRSKADWPATKATAEVLWRQRVTEDLIRLQLGGRDDATARELLRKRYRRMLDEMRRGESIDVVEAYLVSLARIYDPHTVYFKPSRKEDFDIDLSNAVEGIGATLQTDGEFTVIMDLLPGGPAFRDGRLKRGDRIVAVAQGTSDAEDVVDLRLDRVVRLIRGKKGSTVKLIVLPAKAEPGQTTVIDIVRERVVMEDQSAKGVLHEVTHEGRPAKVGVINVPGFYVDHKSGRSVSRDVSRIVNELRGQGAESLVVDLRMNGGGSLGEAVSLSGLFIDKGPVVQTQDTLKRREVLDDDVKGTVWDGPLTVLVSPVSASASEIFAAALQDYGRAIIVGSEQTHGKGTVQILMPVASDLPRHVRPSPNEPDPAGALKLTVQQFFRVDGRSVQLDGVKSDIVLPSPYDGMDIYESDLDFALPSSQISAVLPGPLYDLAPMIATLKPRVASRVAASEGLQKMVKRAAENKDRTSVVLSLTARKAEIAASGEDAPVVADDIEARLEAQDAEKDKNEPDPVLDETLLIAADFARLQAGRIANRP